MDNIGFGKPQNKKMLCFTHVPRSDGTITPMFLRPDIVQSGPITVIFDNQEEKLIEEIQKADFVLGAIAWLTHSGIIRALASLRYGAAILVQKEDFLRPDRGTKDNEWRKNLRRRYDRLHCKISRNCLPPPANKLSQMWEQEVAPVRCVGNHNKDKDPAFPRMHNKYAIFCKVTGHGGAEVLSPYAVWTGSFNFTETAVFSLENSVFIEEQTIAKAYAQDWGHIFGLSEPLDWESDWVFPEYYIGS